jgi:hypothetical protein
MLISPEAILRQISGALIIGDVLAAEILLKIAEGPLLPVHREAVVLAINTKLDTSELAPVGRGHAKMQSHESAYNYLTASDLQVLDSEKSLQDKMVYIAHRFAKLGLRHPTEKTYATLVAIAMLGMEVTIDSEILGMVRQLKGIFRNITAKLPAVDAPTTYPKTASEFKEKFLMLYEAAYQGEEPTVVADETAWLFRISRVPLRCTRTGCASALDASITRQGSRKQQEANVALMHMLALHQRANMPSQAPDPFGGINLQIYGQKPLGGDRSLPSSLQPFGVPGNQFAIEGSPPFCRYGSQASSASSGSGFQADSLGAFACQAAGAQQALQGGSQAVASQAADAQLAIAGDAAQPRPAEVVAGSVDEMVLALQSQLGKKGKAMKRPAAAVVLVDGQRLGCSKCRYGPGGCKQCRVVSFTGKRQKD